MKVLYFEAVGGASGDMILGALFELGVDPEKLQQELRRLPLDPFRIEAAKFQDRTLHGTQVTVHLEDHHHHAGHGHRHGRNLKDIRALVEASALPTAVQKPSLDVFGRIAAAEAKVHGTTPEQVHFHEVGAMDSIVDIVGCCLGLSWLAVDAVAVAPLPAGQGLIRCAHGTFPNPAPATVELLAGMAVTQTDEPFELVTPTGAALLAAWKSADAPPPGSRLVRAGYSFGHHQLRSRPNLLRATIFESPEPAAADTCIVLECNIDDTTPELLGSLAQRLLEAGALDAFTTAANMKKQRPGTLLTVLCGPDRRDLLLDLIFRESTTFGVREHLAQRTVLERRFADVETPYGRVRVKIGRWRGADVTWSPEMDDCIARAREKDVPVRAVYEAAVAATRNLRGPA